MDVHDTTLYYEDEGTGPALLFLHGWGTSARVWAGQLPEFAAEHRVVTVDWRGCGRSARPARGNDVAGVVADLAALIAALGLDRPVVIGSSLGGTFATELALRHPDLVGGVVSVGGPAHFPAQGMPIAQLRADLLGDRARAVTEFVAGWFGPEASPELVAWSVRQVLDSGAYIDVHFDEAARYDPRPHLPGLRVPIQFIHGEFDAIPVDVPLTLATLVPGAEVAIVPRSGHMPHQEQPAAFNQALHTALTHLRAPATLAR